MSRWIRNLKFSTKLLVIMIAGLFPLVLLSALYLRGEQRSIHQVERELAGMQRYRGLQAMLLPVGEHEVWSAAAVAGEGATDKLQAASDDMIRLISQQEEVDPHLGDVDDGNTDHWNQVKQAWDAVNSARPTSVVEVVRLHSLLRQRILDYRDDIATDSRLLLDDDPARHFMIDATVAQIPNYESYVTQMRSHAAGVGAAGKATVGDVEQLTRDQVLAQSALDQISADVQHTAIGGAAISTARADAESSLAQVQSAFDDFTHYVRDDVTSGPRSDSLDSVLQHASQLTSAIASFHDSMQQSVEQQLERNEAALRSSRNRMVLLVTLAVALGMGFMGAVIFTTVSGMNEAVAVVSRVSEGDYTYTIVPDGRDELAHMMRALQAMQGKLSGVLSSVKDSAITVATAARQINAGTSDLSMRTEQQAANLEETASSMEEMTATVKQNADNAKLANKLAQAARDQAEHGGSIVEQTVAAMAAIDVSSKKIADIISVIDEIAFQTNLLALNAAVEAARAGDQGRGFAVVASEVRSLAQRSASAAKEIKGLIQDSVGKVAEGSRLVSESGRHLNDIVASVKKVSDVVGEISNASQEQAASAEEISRAVVQMDEGTQQNAAMVEQASAAAGSMNDQAARLTELTAFFRLPETVGVAQSLPAGVTQLSNVPTTAMGVAVGRQQRSSRLAVRSEAPAQPGPRSSRKRRAAAGPLAPSHEPLSAAAGADWDEF